MDQVRSAASACSAQAKALKSGDDLEGDFSGVLEAEQQAAAGSRKKKKRKKQLID